MLINVEFYARLRFAAADGLEALAARRACGASESLEATTDYYRSIRVDDSVLHPMSSRWTYLDGGYFWPSCWSHPGGAELHEISSVTAERYAALYSRDSESLLRAWDSLIPEAVAKRKPGGREEK